MNKRRDNNWISVLGRLARQLLVSCCDAKETVCAWLVAKLNDQLPNSSNQNTRATERDLSDHVKHVRTIHFAMLTGSVVIFVTMLQDPSDELNRALDDLDRLLLIRDKWNPDWLEAISQKRLSESNLNRSDRLSVSFVHGGRMRTIEGAWPKPVFDRSVRSCFPSLRQPEDPSLPLDKIERLSEFRKMWEHFKEPPSLIVPRELSKTGSFWPQAYFDTKRGQLTIPGDDAVRVTVEVGGLRKPETILIRRIPDGTPLRSLKGIIAPVHLLLVAPDQETVVAVCRESGTDPEKSRDKLILWASRNQEHHSLDFPNETVRAIAFSPDGSRFAVGRTRNQGEDESSRVMVWQTPSSLLALNSSDAWSTDLDGFAVNSLAFSGDGTTLLVGGDVPNTYGQIEWKGKIYRYDLTPDPRAAIQRSVANDTLGVRRIKFVPKTSEFVVLGIRHIASVGDEWHYNGDLERWALTGLKREETLFPEVLATYSCSTSPNGELLAFGVLESVVLHQLRHAADVSEVPSLKGHSGPVTSLSFGSDSQLLVTGSSDGSVRFWDCDSHKSQGKPIKFSRRVAAVDTFADNKRVAIGLSGSSSDGFVTYKLVEVAKFERDSFLKGGNTQYAFRGQFSEDGSATVGQVTNPVYVPVECENVSVDIQKEIAREARAISPNALWLNGSFSETFADLDQATEHIQDSPIEDLRKHLLEVKKTTGERVEILGIKLPVRETRRWGFIFVVALQVYFWLHLSSLRSKISERDKAWDVPWIGFYEGFVARVFFLLSAILIPIVVIWIAAIGEIITTQAWEITWACAYLGIALSLAVGCATLWKIISVWWFGKWLSNRQS